jgi:hypothetical protein
MTLPLDSQQLDRLRQLEVARHSLDRHTDALEIIVRWRDELRAKLARARLKSELIGLPDEEQQALTEEANAFRRCCRGLAWPRRRAAA